MSSYSQIVDALQWCAALPADYGVAIATDQRIIHRLGAGRAVEFDVLVGHATSLRPWNPP